MTANSISAIHCYYSQGAKPSTENVAGAGIFPGQKFASVNEPLMAKNRENS